MSTYLLINLTIVVVPLFFSFENKLKFYKKIPAYLFSVLIVSTVYVIWDSLAVTRGDWGFNDEHILGIRLINLPLEEYLFFLTVPYSCIFIFESTAIYIRDEEVIINKSVLIAIAVMLLITAIIFSHQFYTLTVLIFTALFLLIAVFFFYKLLQSKVYWITIAISFIPFLIFNFVLTYIPVVVYSPNSIWGMKIISIPVEDFFYSYSMISFWILLYSIKENKIKFSPHYLNLRG
jgi:lycopene cyclase domain-containing protein